MSQNFTPQNPMRPLSVGNIVSAGLRLYREHLKTYLQLALYASLWSLVPVYGWAKASAIAALISRLAFGELTNQPESVDTARSQVNQRLWDFLLTAILVGLIFYGFIIGLYIALAIFIGIGVGLTIGLGSANVVAITILSLLGIILVIGFIAAITWIYSRLVIAEVPLAIESNMNPTVTIGRSWQLTKSSVWRIQGVIFLAFLITLPLLIPVQVIVFLFQEYLAKIYPKGSASFSLFSFLISYILGLAINIFIMPFWQTIKSAIYYDLRSRKEGLGLQLRDR